MVNYRDPAVVAQDYWLVTKIWHAVAGVYFWEFVTTLDYEWSIIRGRRGYGWTIWIYMTTRMATLIAMILCLIGIDVTTPFNCEVETIFQLIFGYLTVATASLLIVLRMVTTSVAIWNGKKIVIGIATGLWGINVSFLIQSIVRVHGEWSPAMTTCLLVDLRSTELNLTVLLATDTILLLIMSVGLLRLGFHERSAFGVGRLLWRQGLIWLLVATIAEAMPAMFQIPAMVALSIAATRIHRGLTDYASGLSEHDSVQASGHIGWTAGRLHSISTRTTPLRGPTNKIRPQKWGGSLIIVEGQLCDKPARQPTLVGNDVECPTQVP
ncbi:hypothetical protein BJV77DRAFT_958606 [Russula vinacea]|nr:hypothetical protein BJV77DRAFT_958606 [Russula vinacea]